MYVVYSFLQKDKRKKEKKKIGDKSCNQLRYSPFAPGLFRVATANIKTALMKPSASIPMTKRNYVTQDESDLIPGG